MSMEQTKEGYGKTRGNYYCLGGLHTRTAHDP